MAHYLTFDPLNLSSSRRLLLRKRSERRRRRNESEGGSRLLLEDNIDVDPEQVEVCLTEEVRCGANVVDSYDGGRYGGSATMSAALRRRRRRGRSKCENGSVSGVSSPPVPGLRRSSTAAIDGDDAEEEDDENGRGNGSEDDTFCSPWTEEDKIEVEEKGTRRCLYMGQTVYWTESHHLTSDDLEVYRKIGDPEMDELLRLCHDEGVSGAGRFDDVVSLAASAAASSAPQPPPSRVALASFHKHYSTPPPWVDFDQIQRGINVFVSFAPAAGSALFYRSLVGGFSIPKITAVLQRTKYLAPPSPPGRVAERLLDTGGFLTCCFAASPENEEEKDSKKGNELMPLSAASLRPGGEGWKAALRVRALHAKVRRSILEKEWDIDCLGIPINQEDMVGTLLAFSVNVLLGIEFAAGRSLDDDDQRDYLALWRYLGWLIGVDTDEGRGISSNPPSSWHSGGGAVAGGDLPPLDPCGPRGGPRRMQRDSYSGKNDINEFDIDDDPIDHAYATLESIVLHLLQPDASSGEVARHILNVGRPSPTQQLRETSSADSGPTEASVDRNLSFLFRFRCALCRRFLGDPLADALGLYVPSSRHSWEAWILSFLVTFYLLCLRVYTLATLKLPWARRLFLRWHRRGMASFHEVWTVRHEDRVEKAASMACPVASSRPSSGVGYGGAKDVLIDGGDNPTVIQDGEDRASTDPPRAASSCKFALLQPPLDE